MVGLDSRFVGRRGDVEHSRRLHGADERRARSATSR